MNALPDVGATGVAAPAKERVDDEKEILELAERRIDELGPAIRAGLPVYEERRCPSGVRVGLEPGRQHLPHRFRVGPILDDEEVAHVVPGWAGDEDRPPLRRARQRVPL